MICQTHDHHTHVHGPACGHPQVQHGDHIDYLHDGHLHHAHGDHIDDHQIDVSAQNPDACQPVVCTEAHGAEAVPHGDHTDFLVNGMLHHRHGDHCDNHGPIALKR